MRPVLAWRLILPVIPVRGWFGQDPGLQPHPATGALTMLSTSPYTAGSDPFDLTVTGTVH